MITMSDEINKSNHKAATSKYPTLCHNIPIFINILLSDMANVKLEKKPDTKLDLIYIYIYLIVQHVITNFHTHLPYVYEV